MATYHSYKKFQELTEKKIEFLRKNDLEKSPIIFNFQHYVGYQAKMASFLSKCTKINLSAQELWEVEVLSTIFFSQRLDVNFIGNSAGEINQDLKNEILQYKEILGEQYFNYEGRNTWEIASKKDKEKKCSESEVVSGLSSKRFVKKEGGTNFYGDIWNGSKSKVKYPKHENISIWKEGNILTINPEILNGVKNESSNILFINGYLSVPQIVELFEKHKLTLGKLHRSGKFRFPITDSDISCNLNNFCTINQNGNIFKVYDWEALTGWKEKIHEKEVQEDLLSIRHRNFLGSALRGTDLALLLLLAKEEDFDNIVNNAIELRDNPIYGTYQKVIELYEVMSSKIDNISIDKSDNPAKNLLIYEIINQKEDDVIANNKKFLKVLENILYVAMKREIELVMEIDRKEENGESQLSKILKIISLFEDSDKKRFLEAQFQRINNINMKIETNTTVDEIVVFKYSKASIFNLGIDIKKLKNNVISLEKETSDIFEQIIVVNYPEKTMINYFLNENLGKSSELTSAFIEMLQNLFSQKEGYLRETEIKEMVTQLRSGVRENELQKKLKNMSKENLNVNQRRKI